MKEYEKVRFSLVEPQMEGGGATVSMYHSDFVEKTSESHPEASGLICCKPKSSYLYNTSYHEGECDEPFSRDPSCGQ